jgi:hypothetical protein
VEKKLNCTNYATNYRLRQWLICKIRSVGTVIFISLPGRSVAQRLRSAHGRRPCWGWVREGVAPYRNGSPGVLPPEPGILFASYFASGDFWCVSVVKKVVLFAFAVDKKGKQIPELTVI